ncbi:hypothetical protein [Candidatus Magnetaquicoccus inordinatus]|uniref:hypothetical protein n=1 Tax=Candidatus Magnetaquicoccus inordinatus TaxID=2496818 RepID=UPI00102C1AF9|nr:hypothetical protein [Candidatus Magnetaquicoccus inordinatus]
MFTTVKARINPLTIAFVLSIVITFALLDGCQAWRKMAAYTGKDGALYFNIPDGENYSKTEVLIFTVSNIQDGKFSSNYWSFSKKYPISVSQKIGESHELPLRYGNEPPGAETEFQPKEIINGIYSIRGFVILTDAKKISRTGVNGKFVYENGSVQNM